MTLDAVLTFTMDEKTLVVTPNFDFGAIACFDIYMIEPGGNLFGDITIAVSVLSARSVASSSPASRTGATRRTKPGILKGTPYWEAYQIATTDDGCCGPFNFDITIYFLEGGVQLFDVAEDRGEHVDPDFDAVHVRHGPRPRPDAVPTFTEWTLGFLVEW